MDFNLPEARALQRTAAPLGGRTVRIICQRLLQSAGRFRRRSLLEIGYTGYVGQEFLPTRDPYQGLHEAIALCDV